LNNCATGIATQNQKLRDEHFHGLPERVMKYFEFLARDVREILASLGIREFSDVIGRSDLLEQLPGKTAKQQAINLDAMLASAATRNEQKPYCTVAGNPPFDNGRLNQEILVSAREALDRKDKWSGHFGIHNYDRSVGASLSGEVARLFGREGLAEEPGLLERTRHFHIAGRRRQ
jgi:glutamate synthase (NADPH/NADH) large chain